MKSQFNSLVIPRSLSYLSSDSEMDLVLPLIVNDKV